MIKTTDQFVTDASEIHYNKYDYSKFKYKGSKVKGIIICMIHGEFKMTPNNHLSKKQNCPKCAILERVKKRSKSLEYFILQCNRIHSNEYIYDKTKYKNDRTPVEIICKLHGSFWQIPSGHIQGYRCPKCSNELNGYNKRLSTNEFLQMAKIVHGETWNYSDVKYVKSSEKVKIICKTHGIFEQLPQNHLRGYGCPSCHYTISSPEQEFLDYLKIPNHAENRQFRIHRKKVDGYDPRTNTIYEFLGDYWHGNIKSERFHALKIHPILNITFQELYNKTFVRLSELKSYGYNVNYIWETDWNNFKKGIDKEPKISEL